jgi:hypothetical protein
MLDTQKTTAPEIRGGRRANYLLNLLNMDQVEM